VADRPRSRAVLLALAAVNFGWVFLSASRGTFFVALVLALYVLGLALGASRTRDGRIRAGAVAGLLAAVVVAGWLGSLVSDRAAQSVERLTKLFDSERSLANRTSGRSDLARIGWEIFQRHPFGIGTGEFVESAADYGAKESLSVFHEGQRELQAHSVWVKTLAENGVPGILALAAFVASFAVAGWRRREAGVLGLGVLASVVLALAFLSTEFQAKGIWLFAAAVIVVLKQGRWRRLRRAVVADVGAAGEGTDEWSPRAASASR
ncbi:MAG TPA: O-antigen ligase family protein, partial [Thermoanaerobaculia bacterium]|nr:O-antigen ligase family protein [Thermoanaerobaculia bacterium]